MLHALVYACHIFNILPVKGLANTNGNVCTPHTLLIGEKPKINHYRVFGCPVVAHKRSTPQNSSGKQTKHGIRGIFIGFNWNQKGYIFYAPESCQIYISGDVLFDESFGAAMPPRGKCIRTVYLSIQCNPVSLLLILTLSTLDPSLTSPSSPKRGTLTTITLNTETDNKVDNLPQHEADDDNLPDLLHPNDDSSASNSETELNKELEDKLEDEMDIAHNNEFGDYNISLQLLAEL
jgi:hypothetical protein